MDRYEQRLRRMAMRGVTERLAMSLSGGGVEMRSRPSGHGTTNFEWRGYATVYDADFPMYDQNGDPFTESVGQGACRRTLANPNLDVPFVFGHSEWGIPFARTSSGSMRLSEDAHGLEVNVPEMDGRREDVRALASAVERGDVNEMSLAFVCNRQQWDDKFEHRTVQEMDLHRGDVSAVIHGANPATAGAAMFPVEQLSFRRPAAIGGPVLLGRERRASAADDFNLAADPDYNAGDAMHEAPMCPQCRAVNDGDANYCDQCGASMGQSATVNVDATTGIPGEETQFSDAHRRERLMRELDLEELARR